MAYHFRGAKFNFDDPTNQTSGTPGHDHLNGGNKADALFGRGGDDALAGKAGNDLLAGGAGDDKVWGGSGNDLLRGGTGNDVLVGGFGADHVQGRSGNDVLLSRSDSGEMRPAQGGDRVFGEESAAFTAKNDTFTGGQGADTFRFEGLLNGKESIVAKHTNADGTIDWAGVTGENGAVHDHWVDGFGRDTITDFHRAQGDKIEIAAHTAEVKSIKHLDANHDGKLDTSVIKVISQQGNAGAHDEDQLGTITVHGDLVSKNDVNVDAGVTYGAYNKVADLQPGHHFLLEDDGVCPAGIATAATT